MLSKSLIQFSVDRWSSDSSLLFTWGQTMVEVMKIMVTSFRRSHACTYTLSTPSRPPLTHASTGDSWTFLGKLGQSLVGSPIFCRVSWYTHGSICALQESISQSCVSSGSSVVGLMTTLSKRAYAIPRSAAARAPGPVAVHC